MLYYDGMRTKVVQGVFKPRRWWQARWFVPVVAGAVILMVIVVVAAYWHGHKKSTAIVCGDTISGEVATQNSLANAATFGQLVTRIKSNADYARDPNCLYAIAEYQITAADLSSAKATINSLQATYGMNYKFNRNLDTGHASIANLRMQFDRMQAALNNVQGSASPDL